MLVAPHHPTNVLQVALDAVMLFDCMSLSLDSLIALYTLFVIATAGAFTDVVSSVKVEFSLSHACVSALFPLQLGLWRCCSAAFALDVLFA